MVKLKIMNAQKILSKLRGIYGISDEFIASAMGVSSMTVYRWRMGKANPSHIELEFLKKELAKYKG